MVRILWEQHSSYWCLEIPDRLSGQRVEKEMRNQVSGSVFLGHPFVKEYFHLGDLNRAFLVFSEM